MTKKAEIYYFTLNDEMPRTEKLAWFKNTAFKRIDFDRIIPDKTNNWLNQTDNDFQSLMPVCDKEVKNDKQGTTQTAIFKLFSLGVVTARDEWVYDNNKENLEDKIKYLIDVYNNQLDTDLDYSIKWTRAVKNDLDRGVKYKFIDTLIVDSLYRPFIKKKLYFSKQLNEMQYQLPSIFGIKNKNIIICINVGSKDFNLLASSFLADYHFNGDSNCLPLYTYDKDGNRHDNITDWALNQFKAYYAESKIMIFDSITKETIFHYVYAVLHNRAYRKKYEVNLKREFPRIPFYSDFEKWVDCGKQLMELHLNYETVAPFSLQRETINELKNPKAKLKADKENGSIILDDNTLLSGIPSNAWDYKLGNRSALEWVLDQYKEKKPKDKTIAEKFNTYRFADYKEQLIDLLTRVCTVSVETIKIIETLATLE